ncbi:hypothetical protein [Streptomyces mayteni]
MSTSPPQETTPPPAASAAEPPDAEAPALVIVGSDAGPVCEDGVCHL